ncbi:hypothetical protein ISX56_35410, partial [Serratia ureilytica]|nr:hypothetical protein [Serratia ureilytica]
FHRRVGVIDYHVKAGMLVGVNRYAASEFSFILAVPMMIGASGLDLYKDDLALPLTWGDLPVCSPVRFPLP